jgi:pimeloyl-ACP methyl ester carboxylesterase
MASKSEIAGGVMQTLRTDALEIAYEATGPQNGCPIVLVHGWPDDAHCWDKVTPALVSKGFRVLAPYLRGFGPTRFLSSQTMRSGQVSALATDLANFLSGLGIRKSLLVGHDWGARTGCAFSALYPERVSGLVTLSVGYPFNFSAAQMDYAQSHAYWYQWLMATERGREVVERDRRRFCKFLWHLWSPSWEFSERDFDAAAKSWENPDWAAITIHSYRQRWGEANGDPAYENLDLQLATVPAIRVPTVVLHGEEDRASLPQSSEGKSNYFISGYRRRLIPNVGHFIPREAPEVVLEEIIRLAEWTDAQAA